MEQKPKNGLLFKGSKELAPFVAFGYYTAAIRGEIPPVLSRKHVRKWLESRGWVQERRTRASDVRHIEQYRTWIKNMTREVVDFLQ